MHGVIFDVLQEGACQAVFFFGRFFAAFRAVLPAAFLAIFTDFLAVFLAPLPLAK